MRSIGRFVSAGVIATLLSVPSAPLANAHTLPDTYKFTPNPQVDAVFAKFDSTTSPGCSAAAAKDGKLIYSRGYGMANLDHSIPNTPQTPFHVASVSKQFTAASIVLLAQEGKLSLDDDVRKYLPEVPDLGTTITLRQMIHHTSGVRDQWELLGLAGWRYSLDRISDDDVLRLMTRQRKLNFAPNSRYMYSNMGYTLLALVVKRVSGQSLRDFTTERIFKPLGMVNSHFRNDHAEIVPGFANGYERADDSFKTSVTNFDTTGATSLLTTAEDLLRWDENFYTSQVGGQAFTEQMLERGVLNDGEKITYAFGLMHDTYRGLETIGHGGADAGYRATVMRFPKQHFGITVVCNIAEAQPDVLAKGIADVYLSAELQPKSEKDQATPKPVKVSAKELRDKVGMYLNRLDGQFLRIVEKDGRLHTARPSGSTQGLIPVGANRFRFESFPAVVFEFSGAGEQRAVTTRMGEQKPTTFVAVPEFSPSASELNEYAGLFASEELDVRYRIVVKDGTLQTSSLKSNPMPLQAVTKDVFANPFFTATFVRDTSGRVTGCSISSGRAWNNEFVRMAE